jgi:2-succinyl-5-enolpyruvyl-6-hydroxy-3-cyclohexene-1-carboxylate synthase
VHFSTLEVFSQIEIDNHPALSPDILIADESRLSSMKDLFKKYPKAEPSLVHVLSEKLKNQSVYLGNSLPIREWDLAADYNSAPKRVVANRGANGIDGQISSFLGWADTTAENWCVIGDLTALYDMSAPWAVSQMEPMKLRIVIINNKGGQIFKRLFNKDIFLNKHDISFDHWAAMWNWNYSSWKAIPGSLNDLSDKHVIELLPDPDQTDLFWNEWDSFWKA